MGYTTEFLGSFYFSRSLTEEERVFLTAFSNSRRVKWDPKVLQAKYGGIHGNPTTPTDPYGLEGDYCTLEVEVFFGENMDAGLIDYNEPPVGQPSLWCNWIPNSSGTKLIWNGAEKFYSYVEWLQYLLDHFFIPWGVTLNGAVQWEGEDRSDIGIISVRNNRIAVHYEEAEEEDSDQEN